MSYPEAPSLLSAALSKANSLLVPCEIHFDDVEDRLAYVIALLRLGSEKVDLHGTPPSYQAVSRLQVPTPANVGPFQVPHPRPVTMGLKSSDVHQTKERDTGKAVLGMSAAVGEAMWGEGEGRGGEQGV